MIVLVFLQNEAVTTFKKTFTIYNVHLTNGYASTRYRELGRIQSSIANMKSSNRIVMIAGDFNIGAGKKSHSQTSKPNVIDDTNTTMEILYVAQLVDFRRPI